MTRGSTGNGKSARVHLINSIRVDPSKAGNFLEFERDVREQLEASTRRFEKLKTTISNLVRFTTDIRGFVDVDLLEEKANRLRPNMDVVRSLRLTKYILSTMIYLIKGDPGYVEGLKPDESFFERRPRLAEVVKTGTEVDVVLLALYNELPRRFTADHDPQYVIQHLLQEILGTRAGRQPRMNSYFYQTHSRQFEESMYALTGAVLRLLFNVEEVDTDMDIMLYLARSKGRRPVRLKRVFEDDVRRVHQKIDHSLFLLKEAARYVLEETQRDSSFIQQVLNESYILSVLEGSRGATRDLDHLDSLLAAMKRLKSDGIHLCWDIKDKTGSDTDQLNAMMDSQVYRELLLLARDMKQSGSRFFSLLQSVFGFYADLADRYGIGLGELLGRLERTLTSHYRSISKYLQFVLVMEKRLDSFRKSYATFTLIEEGKSEFYKTVIHEVSQVTINFTTSTERGKLFLRHLKANEDFDLLFDPLYGDKIRSITAPILELQDTFPAESKFNLVRFAGRGTVDPDTIRTAYRRIMRIRLAAEAIIDFYGNLLEDGRYMFDLSATMDESADVRRHLKAIIGYCKERLPASEKPTSL